MSNKIYILNEKLNIKLNATAKEIYEQISDIWFKKGHKST